jgi:hypothetical protein
MQIQKTKKPMIIVLVIMLSFLIFSPFSEIVENDRLDREYEQRSPSSAMYNLLYEQNFDAEIPADDGGDGVWRIPTGWSALTPSVFPGGSFTYPYTIAGSPGSNWPTNHLNIEDNQYEINTYIERPLPAVTTGSIEFHYGMVCVNGWTFINEIILESSSGTNLLKLAGFNLDSDLFYELLLQGVDAGQTYASGDKLKIEIRFNGTHASLIVNGTRVLSDIAYTPGVIENIRITTGHTPGMGQGRFNDFTLYEGTDYPDLPSVPTLSSISSPDNDGNFTLSWNSVSGADEYHLYRHTSSFSTTSGLSPIYQGSLTSYNEIDLPEGNYYYGVIALNSSGASGLSNIEHVVVDYPDPPDAPHLISIPSPDDDGDFTVKWLSVSGADEYHLYRHTSSFSSTSGLSPIYQGSSIFYVDLNLPEGDYYYRVIALNSIGISGLSNMEHVLVDYPEIPIAPSLISIPSPDYDGNFTVSWTSVSGADEYRLYRHPSSFSSRFGILSIYQGSSTSYDEIDLAEGDYYYGVVALNSSGISDLSNIEHVEVFYTYPPDAPILSSIPSPDDDGDFSVFWTSVSGADEYHLYRHTSSFSTTSGLSPIYQGSLTSYNEIDLSEGDYYYGVIALNSSGDSGLSNIEYVVVDYPDPPSEPTLYSIPSPDDDGDFSVSWNSVSGADEYHLYRHTSSFSNTSGLTPIYQGSSTSYNELDLPEEDYYYGVIALNSSGASDLSNIEHVVVDYPDPPSEPTLYSIPSPDDDGNFTISWTSVPAAEEYLLYRHTSSFSNTSGLSPIYQGSLTSYNEIDLSEGNYYYGVVALNSSGASDPSNIEHVVVDFPDPPSEPTLYSIPSPDDDGNFTISWTSVPAAEEYLLYRHTSSFSTTSGLSPIYQGSLTSYSEIDLPEGDYYYGVIALNSSGTSGLSNIKHVVVDYPDPPNAPYLITFSSPDNDGHFTVSWTSVYAAEEYHLYRHTSSFSSIIGLSPIYQGSLTFYIEIDLSGGNYYYGVVALNWNGTSDLSNIEEVIVEFPVLPTEPFLLEISSPDDDGDFLISWTDISNADSYKLYRSSENFTDITTMNPIYLGSASNFNEYNLEDGIYYYRVVAVNSAGDSNPSNLQSVSVEILSGTDPTNNNFLQKYGIFGLIGFGVGGGVIAISIIRRNKLKTLKDIHKSQNVKFMEGSSIEFIDPSTKGNIGMNICSNCQGKNPPGTSFCIFCGFKF